MVEELANKFESAIVKGFTNIFILSILQKEPSHGYKIKKEIENKTWGLWIPADSTLYTDLKRMTEDGLIKCHEKSEGERVRKIYELTSKGKNTLSRILKKQKSIKNAIGYLMTLFMDEDETKNLFFYDSEKKRTFFPMDMINENLNKDISLEEKIHDLLLQKDHLKQYDKIIQNVINKIDIKLSKLEEKKKKNLNENKKLT